MKMKTMLKLLVLTGWVAWGLPAHAGKFSDLEVFTSSGAYFIGYPNGAGSIRPGLGLDAVLLSSGAAVVQSTSATAAHRPFRVKNNAGTDVLGVRQDGTTVGTFSGNLTGNASGTAGSLAANGANCAANSYPLGVDASGAVESCTAAGTGDAVRSATQTFSGANTFTKPIVFTSTVITAPNTASAGNIPNVVVNFTGATGAINYNVGVTSVTHTSTGYWDINFSGTFLDANYTVLCGCAVPTASNGGCSPVTDTPAPSTKAVRVKTYGNAGGSIDCEKVNVVIYGGQ